MQKRHKDVSRIPLAAGNYLVGANWQDVATLTPTQKYWVLDYTTKSEMDVAIRATFGVLPCDFTLPDLLRVFIRQLTPRGRDKARELGLLDNDKVLPVQDVARKVPAGDREKNMLKCFLHLGAVASPTAVAIKEIRLALHQDDDPCKATMKKLRESGLVDCIGNRPRLKYYLSEMGKQVAEYILQEF